MIKSYFKSRFLNDRNFRTQIFLTCSLFFNLIYAIFKLVTGIYYRSNWFITVSVYYILISFGRFTILRGVKKSNYLEESATKRLIQTRYCFFCGIMLCITDIVISIIAGFVIYENKAFEYSELIINISIAYTIIRLLSAFTNVIRRNKCKNPLFSVARSLNLTVALTAVFTLQTSLLSKLPDTYRNSVRFYNTLTCSVVFISIIIIGIGIIITSIKDIKSIKKHPHV